MSRLGNDPEPGCEYDDQGRPLCPWCGLPLACLHWDLYGNEQERGAFN